MRNYSCHIVAVLTMIALAVVANAQDDESAPRARDLGIPFDGTPGAYNAITDVAGVTVGHETIVRDLPDNKAVRTGVTAILPRGMVSNDQPVFGAWFALNGNGEMTGTTWLEESGFLEGPVMKWRIDQGAADSSGYWWSLPVVAETWDGYLNDINGFHVRAEHARAALDAAKGGSVPEGSVGGGTGMICHGFKCGIGTSSRIAETSEGRYTVGVLVQANYGSRDLLRIAGVPVGRHLQEERPFAKLQNPRIAAGSIIIVVATDAPLLPHQLKRLLRRAALGLARNGSIASNGSGDIFIAFSTANKDANQAGAGVMVQTMANENINPMFLATVEATEEAIINALIAGRDMRGNRGNVVKAIDHDDLRTVLRDYNRLEESQ